MREDMGRMSGGRKGLAVVESSKKILKVGKQCFVVVSKQLESDNQSLFTPEATRRSETRRR